MLIKQGLFGNCSITGESESFYPPQEIWQVTEHEYAEVFFEYGCNETLLKGWKLPESRNSVKNTEEIFL